MSPIDAGMPEERTLLSWRRTVLALSIAGFALARLALSQSAVLAEILAGIALAVIVSTIILSYHLYKGSQSAVGASTFLLSISAFSLGVIEILLVFQE